MILSNSDVMMVMVIKVIKEFKGFMPPRIISNNKVNFSYRTVMREDEKVRIFATDIIYSKVTTTNVERFFASLRMT